MKATLHLRHSYFQQRVIAFCLMLILFLASCDPDTTSNSSEKAPSISAVDILGNPKFKAISYGGYRHSSRDRQPTLLELKEDMLLLHAMGIRLIRTYNVHLAQAKNILTAISQLKTEKEGFEMYVMLGAWIDCKHAWSDQTPIHSEESDRNAKEIATAVELANQYPDIIKIIAVGNEAMVKWAVAYYVEPWIILKWVNHLQDLKAQGILNQNLWITSSDNYASWGGGTADYHTPELIELIKKVDFISLHTYPMHDSHYNPDFWGYPTEKQTLSKKEKVDLAMKEALKYAQTQYLNVKSYLDSIGVVKAIHIGETGWASSSDGFYGPEGSRACDEYKQGLYYHAIRKWTEKEGITCFYFEAFDEFWKDAGNPAGSENHFGLFTIDGQAKYALWPLVDRTIFKDLKRGSYSIKKSYNGKLDSLLSDIKAPPIR